jgi:hypothetical protein
MSNPERNHFGKTVLDLSERAHHALGHSLVGKAVTRAVTGSQYPGYRQLDYFSRNVTSDIKNTVRVSGDPNAGIVPRFWYRALIMSTPQEELNDLLIDMRSNSKHSPQEAIAYISEGTVHVGAPYEQKALFGFYKDERAVAMRLGKGSLEATMGLWIPEERHFTSVENLNVVAPGAAVRTLAVNYPGLNIA